ncbi:MAG TPA: OmpA family protein [Methylocella sp.]|jgi:outer membrane protein OmpA-like peptidoglycan-associated protein
MSVNLAKFMRVLAFSVPVIGLGWGTFIRSAPAAEQQPLADQIIQALTPKPLTRSLTGAPSEQAPNAAESQFIDSLRNRPSRSITLNEREKIATLDQVKMGYDNDINFDYNSAKIASAALGNAKALGVALSSAVLKGSTFIIEGYTDAKGGDASNQQLSERRADAVKKFLISQYNMPAADLVAVGYGKTRLKNPDNPFGPENRRVRVVNTAANVANR